MGRETALELARRGADVVVNYANSSKAADELVAEIKAMGRDAIAVKANVSDVSQIIDMFAQAKAHFGKLDIVVSNSGVVSFGHLKDVTEEEFDRVFNINTRGQFFVAREAYKNLEPYGRIILMGSITGQAKGVPKHTVYSGSKCAAWPSTAATRRSPSTPSPPAASRPTCTTPSARSTSPTART